VDSSATSAEPRRSLHFISNPRLWPCWPYLPLVRRNPGVEEEYGVMFDAIGFCGKPGYSATVFLTILFEMPNTLSGFLALPKEVFDEKEEIVNAGWSVD
jgi:hypothetical protein